MLKTFISIPALCLLASAAFAADAPHVQRLDAGLDAVIAPGTRVEKIATGFVFTEGPMASCGSAMCATTRCAC